MPKTNHPREFVDQKDYTCPPGDFCKGKHGAAKKSRGIKKFFNSRTRFHAKQQLVKAIIDPESDIVLTKFEVSHKGHSKLRSTSDPGPLIAPDGMEWVIVSRNRWILQERSNA